MPFGIQPAGCDEMGVVHSQHRRPTVHLPRKGRHAAGDGHRRSPGGVIPAGQQHSRRKGVKGHGVPRLQPHAGALHPDGVIVHGEFPPQVRLLQRQPCRHDLGGAGHRQLPVDVLRKQHLAGLGLHHDGSSCPDLKVLPGGKAQGCGRLHQRQQNGPCRNGFLHRRPPLYPCHCMRADEEGMQKRQGVALPPDCGVDWGQSLCSGSLSPCRGMREGMQKRQGVALPPGCCDACGVSPRR